MRSRRPISLGHKRMIRSNSTHNCRGDVSCRRVCSPTSPETTVPLALPNNPLTRAKCASVGAREKVSFEAPPGKNSEILIHRQSSWLGYDKSDSRPTFPSSQQRVPPRPPPAPARTPEQCRSYLPSVRKAAPQNSPRCKLQVKSGVDDSGVLSAELPKSETRARR